MAAVKSLFVLFLFISSTFACIPTVDPDADEWEPESTTSIMQTTVLTSTSTMSSTSTTTREPMCPDGTWSIYNNYCYLVVGRTGTPLSSCQDVAPGAHPASIVDMAENDAIIAIVEGMGYMGGTYYIGGTATVPTGPWSWTDSTPFVYTHWQDPPTYPENFPSSLCLLLRLNAPKGFWYNGDCTLPSNVICKIPG